MFVITSYADDCSAAIVSSCCDTVLVRLFLLAVVMVFWWRWYKGYGVINRVDTKDNLYAQ